MGALLAGAALLAASLTAAPVGAVAAPAGHSPSIAATSVGLAATDRSNGQLRTDYLGRYPTTAQCLAVGQQRAKVLRAAGYSHVVPYCTPMRILGVAQYGAAVQYR